MPNLEADYEGIKCPMRRSREREGSGESLAGLGKVGLLAHQHPFLFQRPSLPLNNKRNIRSCILTFCKMRTKRKTCDDMTDPTFLPRLVPRKSTVGVRPTPVAAAEHSMRGIFSRHELCILWIESPFINSYPSGEAQSS
jgi:hypothetical protein